MAAVKRHVRAVSPDERKPLKVLTLMEAVESGNICRFCWLSGAILWRLFRMRGVRRGRLCIGSCGRSRRRSNNCRRRLLMLRVGGGGY